MTVEVKPPVRKRSFLLTDEKRSELARRLRDEGIEAAARPTVPRRSGAGPAPLSFTQQRFWFLRQLDPASTAYTIAQALRIAGPLSPALVQAALGEVVRRHEALRTTFAVQDGQPVQIAGPAMPVPLPDVDLSALPAVCREAEARRAADSLVAVPFDLARGPLLRAAFFVLAPEDRVLLLTLDHIISDGWSGGVLLAELARLFEAFAAGRPSPLPPLPLQFADYAVWQRAELAGDAVESRLAWWRERLAGSTGVLDLPTDRPRPPVQGFHGRRVPLALGRGPSDLLRATALAARATPFMLVTAALQALLLRYSGQEDIVVGSPVANRPVPELAGIIGPLVNTLVVRGDLSGDPPFRDLLARTRDAVLGAEAHQDLPFELIADALGLERDLSRNPLFQVLLAFQNIPLPDLPVAGITLSRFELSGGGAQLDLTLNLAESPDGLVGFLQARSDLYDVTTAARMAGHLVRLLTGAMDDPDLRLSELPLLGAAERFQVLEEWNDTAAGYGTEHVLHRLIEAQAARTPGAVAAVSEGGSLGDRTLEYGELDRRANRLARRLRTLGVGPESCAGVFMERSLEMIVALLGILKAGGAYLPLDPEYPADRLAYMVESSGAPVLVTQAHLADALPLHAAHVLVLDAEDEREESAEPLHLEIDPESPAYVIYTSGSTGQPKGVAVPHRGVVNRLLWMQDAYRLTAEDRVLQKTPFSFDVSVWELFWPLLTGARLVFARPGGHRDGAYLARLIQEQGITTLHFVPSMLQVFLEEPVEVCRSLRQVFCSGEALPRDLQDRFLARSGAALHNLYGPTEASVDVTFWACGSDARPGVPIGRPMANTRILLLDRSLRPVPIGVPGELCIGGTNLARGYLGRPELTAERFVPDPFAARPGERLYRTGDLTRFAADGAIEYLGRLDHQVKVRGFRIELGEIEAALAAHPRIREAVVVARNGRGQGDRRLVAYLVADGEAPPVGELRQALGARLPDYMVPAVFMALDALPLTPSGKVDRKALPEPGAERPSLEQPFVAPATPREADWAEIWREVLGVDRIGIHDNFFALGGDSIRSLQVLARARERGLSATLQQIFQQPTIHGLLEVQDARPAAAAAEIPPFGLLAPGARERLPARLEDTIEDAWPLARLQGGMLFHSAYSPETAVFHDVFGFHVRAPLDLEALRGAVRELAARHAALRTSFLLDGPGEPLQIVHREVEIPVGLTDLRSLDPAEQPAALESWVAEERRQGFDWSRPPLLRFHVHRRGDDSFHLMLSFHHALLDGWSVASLLSELFQRYASRLGQSFAPAPALRSSFRDFVALEREALASPEQRAFWQRDLAGRTATLLPRWPRPARPEGHGGRRVRKQRVALPVEISEGLPRLASSLGVPVKSALLAAHLRVVQLLTGQVDLITGLVANGRPEERDGERVLGLFLNTLPFRLELGGGTWQELVRQTFATERERLPVRRFPLAEIQRMHGGQPLFETAFNFVSFHVYATTAGLRDLEVLDADVVEETNFPLGAVFRLDPFTSLLQLALDWDTDELHPAQVEALAGYYVRTLAAMAAAPETRYEDAVLLAPEEIQQLVTEANDTEIAGRLGLCVHRLFEEQAARSPESTALLLPGEQNTERLTYGQLNARANRLARRLRALGAGPETVVGLCAERSFEAIAGILGVMKSGAAWLPLDPAYPPERLSFLLEDAHVPILLCQERLLGRLPTHAARVVSLDAVPEGDVDEGDASNLSGGATPLDPAYVIYTSGSTGRPKGVVALHGGLANFALAMVDAIGLDPSHRFLEFASLSFDASAVQIFPTLVSGAALVLHPDPAGLSSHEILRLCERLGVTVLDLPAALWRQFVEEAPAGGFGSAPLSVFMTGGESVAVARLRSWAAAARPESRFISSYGPTETTVTATIFTVSRERVEGLDGRVIPLGRHLPNVRVHLLDRHVEPVPLGVPGEVCIGGTGVTRGYLGRPDLTAQAFTPDPYAASEGEPGARLYRTGDLARRLWDGHLEFLGRFDHQVKIRGFRVEPGEIEAVLAACPEVADAAVVIREDAPGDLRLVAYVVPPPETPAVDLRAVRATLQEKLPAHMVPTAFVVLGALPVNANGKLDRQALPAPEGAGLGGGRPWEPPRTPAEERLAQVWSEVLHVERAGRDDNFFELGGHSLVAMQLAGRLRETFGVDLPLRLLYETATLADLASAIERLQAGAGAEAQPSVVLPSVTPDRAGRFLPFPLTPIQQAYWTGQSELFELGGTGSNVYNELEVTGLLRVFLTRLRAALPRWIERHEMLRSVVLPDGRQQILERVPRYRPEIVDLRGLEPGEVRDRLEAARERLRFARVTAGDWPPFEIAVFRLDGGRLRICARLSALVLDGTSRGVMMQDLFRLMADPHATLPSPGLSFRDYAVARESLRDTEAGRRARDAWMQRLPGLPPAVDLPRGYDGWLPVRPRFVIRTLELLDAAAWQRLRTRAARAGLTPTGALLAAFVDVLALYARSPRFTLSLVGSERFPFHPEVDDLTGNFNTIHLLEVDGWDGPFETRARRLRDRLAADLELPYFSGLEALRELNRLHGNRYGATLPVLFNSVLEYAEDREETDTETDTLSDDSVDVQDVEINIYAPQILLSPTMREGDDGELQCKWQAVDDAFPPGLIAEMATAFESRVRELADREESWQAAPLAPASSPAPPAPERQEPRTAEEEEVAALWQDILGTGGFGMRDEFFAAGGDSFGLARLVSRLEERVVAADPVPRPGLWRRLRSRFARRRAAGPGGEVAAARSLLRERLMAAFLQEPTVENLAAALRRERTARAEETAELAPAPLPEGVKTFTWLWLGQLVSMLGTGLGSFALGLWVYRATGSVTEFALISVFGTVASLLATPLAGALVDRLDRRRIMIAADSAAACISLVLVALLFTGRLQVWHVYVLVAGLAVTAAFQQPAFLASVSLLVPRRFLGRANGMAQLGPALAQTVAPMIAGALLIAIDLEGIISIDLLSFLFGIATAVRVAIPRPAEPADRERGWRALLRDSARGWTYARERPGLLGLLGLLAATNLSLGMVQVLVTPLILSFASTAVLGTILSLSGAGMVAGSLAMTFWGGPRRLVRTMLTLFLVEGVLLMAGGLRPSPVLAGLAALVFMVCNPIINASNQTIWQRKVPADLQGRVFSLQRMVAMSALPIAFALAGSLADRVFEPLLADGGALAGTIGQILGTGKGRGIGLMFELLGLALILTALLGGLYPRLRNLEKELPDATREEGRRRR